MNGKWLLHSKFPSPIEHPHSNTLNFLKLFNWEEGISYDNDQPTCIHYSIEWKVTVNNQVVAKDTEPDLVLAPSVYWDEYLKQKLEE